jgi:hypothetical protein
MRLEPLRASHAAIDYAAVMASRAELRRWSQSTWPAEEFTLEENRADLERHEREHFADAAYTYTVLAPDGALCLGCVYFAPLLAEEARLAHEAMGEDAAYAMRASFWVRADQVAGELDRELFTALRAWLAGDWWFDRVAFTLAADAERQAALCRAAGLHDAGAFELAGRGTRRVFLDALSPRTTR